MKNKINNLIVLAILLIIIQATSFSREYKKPLFFNNTDEWMITNGPGGGFISDIVIDPNNSSIVYAVGAFNGIYKSTNGGGNWNLLKFPDASTASDLEISNSDPAILFSNYSNLSKSTDGGENWQECANGFGDTCSAQVIKIDPLDAENIYIAGARFSNNGIVVYKSENSGDDWTNITGNIDAPIGSSVSAIALAGNGKIFVGINDTELLDWHKGKIFYSDDDGGNWQEINFGQTEDRFIWSIIVNQKKLNQVWVTEGPLYNNWISMPWLYCSEDTGASWKSISPNSELGLDATQIRMLGASSDGNKLFLAGGEQLCCTDDIGNNFYSINLPDEIRRFDLSNIQSSPDNPSELFLPTGSGGVAYSQDNGSNWIQKNDGILATSINLLAPDPQDPGKIYSASWIGEGTFRTDDYGRNWTFLNSGGIVHPYSDELLVDPVEPNNVWFISDVPYIHKSSDYGNSWNTLNHPYQSETFNFASIYAMGQSSDDNTIYALNNGFGIFKGTRDAIGNSFDWEFLHLSDIDYSYSLAVVPDNSEIVFSGYSRKPFETKTMIRKSDDGGDTWETSLEIDSAEAVTSVIIDKNNTNNLYATSVGESGAVLWKSENQGDSWDKLNEYFNFTNIHSFAVSQSDSNIMFAGVWGGGTYKTTNQGMTWNKLENEESFSASAIAIDPNDADIIYLADRTKPIVYKSLNCGETWIEYFNAGNEYRRIMALTIDPTNTDRIFASAMKLTGPGKEGGLFKIQNGISTNINNSITKVPLTITIDPTDSSTIYIILHETGVFKSTDSGDSWFDISAIGSGLPEIGFNNLTIDPNNSDRIYLLGGSDFRFSTLESAGIDPDSVNAIYRSDNGGTTWENINRGILGEASGNIKSISFYNNQSDIIYIGTETGVYYTIDTCNSWEKSSGLSYTTLGGVALSGEKLFAYTRGAGLFLGSIQTDKSIVWESDSKINMPIYFAQLLKDCEDDSVIFASAYPGGIFKSYDNGATWQENNFGMTSFKVDDPLRQGYYAMAQSQSNSQILYLGIYEKGVYRSTNGGDVWYPINGTMWEMYNKKITSIAIDNLDENKVYVGSENGIYTTDNGGQNWTAINDGLTSLDIKTLFINSNNNLYAGTRGYGLYQWYNNYWMGHSGFGNWGVTWQMWDDRPMYQYTSLLIHPEDNSRMMIGTFPQGIYKSVDGGITWKESNIGWTNDGVFSLICHPENPEIVYAGTYNGINKSTDFGEHWEMWNEGIPPEQWVFSIDFDPTNSDIMYACSKNGENEGVGIDGFKGTVIKSTNGGESWTEITNGLKDGNGDINEEFYKIIVDHYDSDIIYLAGQEGGIYRSSNAGVSWELWTDGLGDVKPGTNGNNVTNTMVMSADHSLLYLGTAGSGVWRRMISPILPINKLNAKVENHNVILNWNFEDINSNLNQFNIYKSNSNFESLTGMSPIANTNDSTYTDNNILQGVAYYYAVTTKDNDGYENEHFYTLGPIVDKPLKIITTTIDTGFVGVEYNYLLESEGGIPPYSWEIISGILPTGLEINSDSSSILGIPEVDGNFNFQLQITDSDTIPTNDSVNYNLFINPAVAINTKTDIPTKFDLKQNYPNPFNNSTIIPFDIPQSCSAKFSIYDITGKIVYNIQNNYEAGRYEFEWYGIDNYGNQLASGIYFYMFDVGNFRQIRKLLILK
ncbi:MAG: T9SS type A sorting domain-containing protein [Candidatus Marinimicrobia bacterium]|nr:T9SS type A sorting domain-containing protein [Candidatus Neomarinimicrobiota bacterium]